ncbi:hypothetical protein KP509_12G006100 [Ceratopteris richardii]|uniref:25S rRNA (uridine-N(3))-methyltransferase BMT5-like domain-containing protein n=1 Tax=Ceratopteris richardii TaxID=49495 RepID=A0A8T2TGF6_CERRI|nr:hypothetical protein KP509_12G006100 [Ceratopteris richardii]
MQTQLWLIYLTSIGFHGQREADERMIKRHQTLVQLFFENAARLLQPDGEVHVSHHDCKPYLKWNLEEQATKGGLRLRTAHDFYQRNYPGYVNRRGHGNASAGSFKLGRCKTFVFKIHSDHASPWSQLSNILNKRPVGSLSIREDHRQQLTSFDLSDTAVNLSAKLIDSSMVSLQSASLKGDDEGGGSKRLKAESCDALQAAKRRYFELRFSEAGQMPLPIPGHDQLDHTLMERRISSLTSLLPKDLLMSLRGRLNSTYTTVHVTGSSAPCATQ